MLIAQISDTHIAGWGKKTFGIAPMAENLAHCVEHINALEPQPDLVLVTGDITNNGLREEMERAADILQRLRPPFYVIPGNHDERTILIEVFGHDACPTESTSFVNYVIEEYALRLITVDSTVPGAAGGEICPERAEWLDARLGEDMERPTIIFMHHPPLRFGVPETDIDGFEGRERFWQVIAKYPQVARVLAGHIHLAALAHRDGVVVSTAPSVGMRLTLDLTLRHPSEFILDDPAYQLHYWSPDQHLVTYTVHVRGPERSYPFAEIPKHANLR